MVVEAEEAEQQEQMTRSCSDDQAAAEGPSDLVHSAHWVVAEEVQVHHGPVVPVSSVKEQTALLRLA